MNNNKNLIITSSASGSLTPNPNPLPWKQQQQNIMVNGNAVFLQSQIMNAVRRIDSLPNFQKCVPWVVRSPMDKLVVPDLNGFSPLHYAAASDDILLAEQLVYVFSVLGRRDFLASVDKGGKTPLHWAVEAGSKRIVKLLIENGAPWNAQENQGLAAIHLAIGAINRASHEDIMRYRDVLEYLLSIVDLNMLDLSGVSTLHLAAELGDLESIRLLIQFGAWVNIKDYQGENALFYAIRGGQLDVIRSLVEEFNIDMNMLNEDEESVLDLCKSIGDQSLTDLVITLSNNQAMNQKKMDCLFTEHSYKLSNPGMLSRSSGTFRFSGHSCA